MKLITIAGPPSSGKTSVIVHLIRMLKQQGMGVCVVKFDCLTSFDQERYQEEGVPVKIGLSGKVCPDHFYISNIEECFQEAAEEGFDVMITESAGLCNRCSPYIQNIPAICVVDCLSGVNTPRKIGPMLKFADYTVVTKGDIVSQAEREVFGLNIRQVNAAARIVYINGITGQGAFLLGKHLAAAPDMDSLKGHQLRFTIPASVCSYCTGEIRIGKEYQLGMLSRKEFRRYG